MTNTNNNVNPNMLPLNPLLPGHVISTSPNIIMALSLLEGYISSTYNLQAADTKLEAAISNAEQAAVAWNENPSNVNDPNAPKGSAAYYGSAAFWLEQLNADANDKDKVAVDSSNYANANALNQASIKEMDGNNSTAQNVLNQNSQGQQGVVQMMSSINGLSGNLTRLIQG